MTLPHDGSKPMTHGVLGIVAINDVYTLDNLPRLASLLAHHRAHTPADRWLVTLAGDFLAPSLLASLDGGRRTVQVLNALGVTHVVLGNHEDDLSTTDLVARVHELDAVWLGTNARSFDPRLVPFDVVQVGDARVGIVGVVMTDPSVYRRPPFAGTKLDAPNDAAEQEALRLREREGCATVVALTHQWMSDDRELAARGVVSVILGGHEHDARVERLGDTLLVKTGMDAMHAAVITVSLTDGSAPAVTVTLEPVSAYAPEPRVAALVDAAHAFVAGFSDAVLVPKLDVPLSAAGSRAAQTSMGTFVCNHLRDALHADVALFNGGGIRGTVAHETALTLGDLRGELPFDNEVVVTLLPGQVVRDAVAYSRRRAPLGDGGFLQVDDGVDFGHDARTPIQLARAPLDPERLYRVALPRPHLLGLDHIEPLVGYAAGHPACVPPAGSGREAKLVLLEVLARERLHALGGFDALDLDHDARVGAADLRAALAREGAPPSDATVSVIVDALDGDHDGALVRAEVDGKG